MNNQLPADVQARIEKEAKRRGENHMFIPMDGDYSSHEFHGFIVERSYIAGATAENIKAQAAIDILEEAYNAHVEEKKNSRRTIPASFSRH